jgi:prepilin-type N-terminal cleavage/methylation domain-containing protein/prepilin-type processing-associated H-X9-DG protein
MRKRSTPAHAGFTLLELLTVIAILSVLAAFLFPAFASAREEACRAKCLANVRQICVAQQMYAADWDELLPHWNFPAAPRPEPWGNFTYWTEFFQPYLRSIAVLRESCADWIWDMPKAEQLGDYSLLTWGSGGQGTLKNPYWQWPGRGFSLSTVARPSETITLSDGFTTGGWTSMDLRRHRGGFIAGFIDGHAKWLTIGEFWGVGQEASGAYYLHYVAADRGW